jgi:hypothetical protein
MNLQRTYVAQLQRLAQNPANSASSDVWSDVVRTLARAELTEIDRIVQRRMGAINDPAVSAFLTSLRTNAAR